jgi:hypothetical protein
MKERNRNILIGAAIILFSLAVIITAISVPDEKRDHAEEEPPVRMEEMDIAINDIFTTDRVTGLVTPPYFTMNFLVLDIGISNPLDRNITFSPSMVNLITDGETYGPSLMDEFVGRSFGREVNIPPRSSASGYLHFNIFPDERPLRILYNDTEYNVTFSVDLTDISYDHRPWETPLEFRITGCGRDENGSGRENYLYFYLEVSNPSDNASHFQCWLIDLDCRNGVKLDGLFVPQPEGDYKFLPGQNVTYKVYFDIPGGSQDRPEVMYQDTEGMRIDIDEELYRGLI